MILVVDLVLGILFVAFVHFVVIFIVVYTNGNMIVVLKSTMTTKITKQQRENVQTKTRKTSISHLYCKKV